jgi:hypothetical protein
LVSSDAPTARHARRVAVVLTAVAGAIALAACGGGSSKSSSTTTSTTAAASSSRRGGRNDPAMAAFRQCLQQHGVTFGGRFGGRGGGAPTTAPNDGSTPTSRAPLTPQQRQQLQAAQQACQSKLPPQTQQQRQQMQAALNAYRSCMKDHGVTIPDQGNGGFGGLRGINRDDPTFQAANKICAPLLPNGGRFFGNGGNRPNSTAGTGGAQA